MKKTFKSVGLFFLFLLLYFIPALLFKSQPEYYKSINKPFYAPPAIIFAIVWPILYVIFSFILTRKISSKKLTLEQAFYFIMNYSISFFFNKVFFLNHNLFLSFVVTFSSFITGLLIFISFIKDNKYVSISLIPYLLWTLYASILMANIYFIN